RAHFRVGGAPAPFKLIRDELDELPLTPGHLAVALQALAEPCEPAKFVRLGLFNIALGDMIERVAHRYMVEQVGPRGAGVSALNLCGELDEPHERPRERPTIAVSEVVKDPGEREALLAVRAHEFGHQAVDERLRLLCVREPWHMTEDGVLLRGDNT